MKLLVVHYDYMSYEYLRNFVLEKMQNNGVFFNRIDKKYSNNKKGMWSELVGKDSEILRYLDDKNIRFGAVNVSESVVKGGYKNLYFVTGFSNRQCSIDESCYPLKFLNGLKTIGYERDIRFNDCEKRISSGDIDKNEIGIAKRIDNGRIDALVLLERYGINFAIISFSFLEIALKNNKNVNDYDIYRWYSFADFLLSKIISMVHPDNFVVFSFGVLGKRSKKLSDGLIYARLKTIKNVGNIDEVKDIQKVIKNCYG